jgi:hypothetical protein
MTYFLFQMANGLLLQVNTASAMRLHTGCAVQDEITLRRAQRIHGQV